LGNGQRFEADYELPFLAHATMEPLNCTVWLKADSCELWLGTQIIARVQQTTAALTGLPIDKVTIHNHLIGGGFGRRLEPDMALNAVRIAQHMNGVPVKVVWTREEDIQQDIYRPVYRNVISASLAGGKVAAWKYKVCGASIMARWLPPLFKRASMTMRSTAPSTCPTTSRISKCSICGSNRLPCRPAGGAASVPTTMCLPSRASWMSSRERPARIRSRFVATCWASNRGSSRRSIWSPPNRIGASRCRRVSAGACACSHPSAASSRRWLKPRWIRTAKCCCAGSPRRPM
jgi:hypothetical protein